MRGSGSPGLNTAPTRQIPLTLVEEHIACIEGDAGEDVVGGTGVALVHPLNLHVQPVGEQSRAQGCWEPCPQSLARGSGRFCCSAVLLTSSSSLR